jgi:hypothetical protein
LVSKYFELPNNKTAPYLYHGMSDNSMTVKRTLRPLHKFSGAGLLIL